MIEPDRAPEPTRRDKMTATERLVRDTFADELLGYNETGLADLVRSGHDTSHGGCAAVRALLKVYTVAINHGYTAGTVHGRRSSRRGLLGDAAG
jgi:hypothetical protein